jgi:FixJ family two-component response regulator
MEEKYVIFGVCPSQYAPKSMLSNARRSDAATQRAPKRLRAAVRKANSTAGGAEPKVLIVDDDPSVLPALARLIRANGFKVSSFDRPSALLASEIPKTNACLLIDVHLPEMTGIELDKKLAESGRGLPVIMITGRHDAETQRLLAQAHPVAALFKPVEERVLLEAIDRALALSKSSQSDD